MPGIVTDKASSRYDDVPGERYHFPKAHLGRVEKLVGDWIAFHEMKDRGRGRRALTGMRLVNGRGAGEVEAAHIKPIADGGPDLVSNGLALTRTVHWMFDRHLITFDEGLRLERTPMLPSEASVFLGNVSALRFRSGHPSGRARRFWRSTGPAPAARSRPIFVAPEARMARARQAGAGALRAGSRRVAGRAERSSRVPCTIALSRVCAAARLEPYDATGHSAQTIREGF